MIRRAWPGVRRCHVGLIVSDLTVVQQISNRRFLLRCACGRHLEADERNILEDARFTCGQHPPADGRTPGLYRLAHRHVREVRGDPGTCWKCGAPAAEWSLKPGYPVDGVTSGGYGYTFDADAYRPACIRHHRLEVARHLADAAGALPLIAEPWDSSNASAPAPRRNDSRE